MKPFLDFDIETAINGGEWYDVIVEGKDAIQKRVQLDPIQLNMFDTLEITKFKDGSMILDFFSNKYAPTKDLMDLMAYCSDLWGADSGGRSIPSEKDVRELKNGTFARTWEYLKLIQFRRDGHFSLTIVMRLLIDNEDMRSFTKNLAKGFVRAAVNQVGRDGGRVISNSVYGGRNYVPISNVEQQSQTKPSTSPAGDSVVMNKPLSTGKIVLCVILSFFLFPVGTLGVLIYGVVKFFDKTAKIEWSEVVPQFTQDNRYRTNTRYIGDAIVKHKQTIPASPDITAINKKNGVIAMCIALACGLLLGISLILT